MEQNNLTPDELKRVINVIENHSIVKDYQVLDEILPLVLVALKSQINLTQKNEDRIKFYAPVWVDVLLGQLVNNLRPLSQEEYAYFRAEVEKLSISDYKEAGEGLMSYRPKYCTSQEIGETVLALKRYFKFI